MDDLADVIRHSPVTMLPGTYCVARTQEAPLAAGHFMVATDCRETTIITREPDLAGLHPDEVRRGYRLIEIRTAAPFEGVGFLATICRAIADVGLNILVVSTYSADYILLEESEAETGMAALRRAGFPVHAGTDDEGAQLGAGDA